MKRWAKLRGAMKKTLSRRTPCLQWYCWHVFIDFQEEKVDVLHNPIHYTYKSVILLEKSKVMSLHFLSFFFCLLGDIKTTQEKIWHQLKSKQCPPQTTYPQISFSLHQIHLVYYFTLRDGRFNKLPGYWHYSMPELQISVLIVPWFHTNLTKETFHKHSSWSTTVHCQFF